MIRILWLSGIVVFALLAGCNTSAPAVKEVSPLVGAWRSKVQFTDGDFASVKDLEFLLTFNEGGTMTESSNYDGMPPVPPAYGIWRSTGPSEFEAQYEFYTTKAPAKSDELKLGWLPAGRGVLKEKIKIALDGATFESSMTLDMFDQADKPVSSAAHAVAKGTKLRF